MDPFIGEIRIFAGGIVPTGWAPCEGQLMSIQQHPDLFALLGDRYGGDGRTYFALPDLRGRTPVCVTSQPVQGVSYKIAQTAGVEGVLLAASEIPAHDHPLTAVSTAASSVSPSGEVFASAQPAVYAGGGGSTIPLAAGSVTSVGDAGTHENRQPGLALFYCIATTGNWPQRS
ncbi:tail fiber protein [Tistrella mobilis]|uniref:phage tail protein n=1 Tax=Tistrella mobilis TaxID=171437 RepID=UPI003556174B